MKRFIDCILWIVLIYYLCSLAKIIPTSFRFAGAFFSDVPIISQTFPGTVYSILVVAFLLSLDHRPGAANLKPSFYVWTAEHGIEGGYHFQDIRGAFPGETLVIDSEELYRSWRPLRCWYSNGSRRNSPRFRLLRTSIVSTTLILHTWHLTNIPEVLWIAGGLTLFSGVALCLIPGSGGFPEKFNTSISSVLLDPYPVRPPDLKS
jgi:hypothetical protein